MDFNKPLSRDEAILQNILGAQNVLSDPQSEIEAILQAILNDTPYTEEGRSRIASLLIAIKNKGVPLPELDTLNVTENGTYTAEEGHAYNEVNVSVPLPSNAYQLKEVEGLPKDITTFTDGSNLPMPSLKLDINPQQDLHGYDAPWVGGSGKNKFDIDATHEEVSGSTTYSYTVTVKPNTAYTMSCNVPQGSPASLYFNGTSTNVNGVWNGTPRTFTSESNGQFIVYVRYDTSQGGIDLYTAVKNGQYYIQLEEGSTATSYAPYSNICPISGWDEANVVVSPTTDAEDGTTYNIQFKDGDNPLTVYGGTLDVVGGTMTVDRAYVDLGTLSWTYNTTQHFFFANINDLKLTTKNLICDRYIYVEKSWTTMQNGEFGKVENFNQIRFHNDNYETAADFKTAMNGVQLVYELATPITIQLTPTAVKSLLGSNNVWGNIGKIEELEYFSKEVY